MTNGVGNGPMSPRPRNCDQLRNVGDRHALGEHQVDSFVDAGHGDGQNERMQAQCGDQEAVEQAEQGLRAGLRGAWTRTDSFRRPASTCRRPRRTVRPWRRARCRVAQEHEHGLTERDQARKPELRAMIVMLYGVAKYGDSSDRRHEQHQEDDRDDDQFAASNTPASSGNSCVSSPLAEDRRDQFFVCTRTAVEFALYAASVQADDARRAAAKLEHL